MSETQQNPNYNPFDPANHSQGGGIWGDKIVTITRSRAVREALTYKGGSPVPQTDRKTKEPIPGTQQIQIGWEITGIVEGQDKERKEVYSVGERMEPTADGEGFVMKDGSPLKFSANSNAGKLSAALAAAGFNLALLFPNGQQKLSALTGARILFSAEQKKGTDGKPLKDKKGYDKMLFLPAKMMGFASGAPAVQQAAASAAPSPLADKAAGAVMTALAAAPGGVLSRADLVRTLAQNLAGDQDANGVIGLVVRDDFHKGRPWKFDGLKAALAQA